ncbi:polysaccharide biosynthesis protein [Methylocaldum marinum]|uniref:Polysaccharide biosynthesis protein n=1 Tax=Methylocaldum marinum TaxID=1432792 RepID=A0A250KWK2_9GAMM|nr:polysaccharide biosynthesis C-terminal domain-containing protein [Methylocaldum marinum]BBA35906.1 polysaccharide biosynthesis protein [Methylocaldum marinum]
MNPLRKLASQTVIYGLSSIIGRFLNYLLVPLYTYTFPAREYGVVSEFYAYAGFFAIFLIFGLETGYFRFSNRKDLKSDTVYSTALGFLILANLAFVSGIVVFREPLAALLRYPEHPEYLVWFGAILALDSIAALPFAKLRSENRAWRFAGIKLIEIALAIGLNLFFLVYCKKAGELWPNSFAARLYDPAVGIGYIFLANLAASAFKLLLLLPQFKSLRHGLDSRLLKSLLAYSLPMVIIGFAGMVNEMLDRAILKFLLPYDLATNMRMLGIYGACYKLSILMSLFIQAFRYAGEPFFFAYAGRADAKRAYALVMKYFVIFCVFIFLLVTLYIDLFKYFVGAEYREGLDVVPILLMANLFLGIYVNLSIWYKLTDRTLMGAWVSLIGAVLTIGLNIWWIPIMGYQGSAWATLACYAAMTIISYALGQYYYPVRYPIGKIAAYLLLGLLLYGGHKHLVESCGWTPWAIGSAFLALYLLIVALADVRPLLGKRQPARKHAPDETRPTGTQ